MSDFNYFPSRDLLPRIRVSNISSGDGVLNIIDDCDQASVLFRAVWHGTSSHTAAAIGAVRNNQEPTSVYIDTLIQRGSLWRPATDTGGMMIARVISATAMRLTTLQALQWTACRSLLITTDDCGKDKKEYIQVSPAQIRILLNLPLWISHDWQGAKYGFLPETPPAQALRDQPAFFGFQDGINEELEQILRDIEKHHPTSHLYET